MALGGALSLDRPAAAGRRAARERGGAVRGRRRSSGDALRCSPLAARPALARSAPARAVQPDEVLQDPALERAPARSRRAALPRLPEPVDRRFRAPLARDLRLLVRERLKAGDSDAAGARISSSQRYGEFVLLRPSSRPHTLLLWLTPVRWCFSAGLGLYAAVPATPQATPKRPARSNVSASDGRSASASTCSSEKRP